MTTPNRTPNFKKVVKGGDFLKPKTWDKWTEGDFIEGVYENASERDLYGKPIYEVKITKKKITGEDPEISSGDKKGIMPLYANGSMDFQMQEASYGDLVRIEYKGMATTTKGKFKGKPCHNIEVMVDGYVSPEDKAAAPAVDDSHDLLG